MQVKQREHPKYRHVARSENYQSKWTLAHVLDHQSCDAARQTHLAVTACKQTYQKGKEKLQRVDVE